MESQNISLNTDSLVPEHGNRTNSKALDAQNQDRKMKTSNAKIIEELTNLFPEMALAFDVHDKRNSMTSAHDCDIEIALDRGTDAKDDTPKASLFVGGKSALVAATDKAKAQNGVVQMLGESAFPTVAESHDLVAYIDNKNGKHITKLLVQGSQNGGLRVSGVVVEDEQTGLSTRIAVNEMLISEDEKTDHLVVKAPEYSLTQHVKDTCSGFLNLDFYERINEMEYRPTLRSLVRHAMNKIEASISKDIAIVHHDESSENALSNITAEDRLQNRNDVISSCGNLTDERRDHFLPSFANNIRVCSNQNGVPTLSNALFKSEVAEGMNIQQCHQVRRRLGMDDGLSTLESSAIFGIVALGVAVSLFANRRRPFLASKAGQMSNSRSLQSPKADYSIMKAFKRIL